MIAFQFVLTLSQSSPENEKSSSFHFKSGRLFKEPNSRKNWQINREQVEDKIFPTVLRDVCRSIKQSYE